MFEEVTNAAAVGFADGAPTKRVKTDDNSFKRVNMASKQQLTAYKFGKTVKLGACTPFGDARLAKRDKKRDILSDVFLGARGGT